MLQMMTSDLLNNIDNNTNINNVKEEENNHKNNLVNSFSTNIENNKHIPIAKIATIEKSANITSKKNMKKENGRSSVPKMVGRFKLPKMNEGNKKFKNEESVTIFDDEKNNINGNIESMNLSDNENSSPKIIKIIKKQGNPNFISGYINSPPRIAYNNKNEIKPISSNKRNFEIFSNDVNKNFSQTNPIP